MKKLLILMSSIALVFGAMPISPALGEVLWQIGKPDGAVNPIQGAAEYPATRAYTAEFDYYVGTDSDPINSPSMPGYIGSVNVCDIDPNRPCTDTTAKLNIHFTLDCTYHTGELTLLYDRYGSESDDLRLDGVLFATISATEGGFRQFSFDLGEVSPGDHTITIEYAGGGSANGHYIDYLKLESTFFCASIDIKPGSYPNCFNINGHGVIPVAILGSADFDVTQINVDNLFFAGLEVRVKGNGNPQCSVEDVSGDFTFPEGAPDGYDDLVCQFVDDPGEWEPDNSTATLTGNLKVEYDGTSFHGTDEICIVP